MAVTFCAMPWYLVVPERHAIRVYHGGLSVQKRARRGFIGEKWACEIEALILATTRLPAVSRVHDGPVVEFRIPPELFPAAAIAVRMEFDGKAGQAPWVRSLLLSTTLPD